MKQFNWSWCDFEEEGSIVQQTVIFLLYMLKIKAKDYFLFSLFVEIYIKAFPMSLEELTPNPILEISQRSRLSRIIPVSYTHLTLPTICSV